MNIVWAGSGSLLSRLNAFPIDGQWLEGCPLIPLESTWHSDGALLSLTLTKSHCNGRLSSVDERHLSEIAERHDCHRSEAHIRQSPSVIRMPFRERFESESGSPIGTSS
jgi:hypothetical protein